MLGTKSCMTSIDGERQDRLCNSLRYIGRTCAICTTKGPFRFTISCTDAFDNANPRTDGDETSVGATEEPHEPFLTYFFFFSFVLHEETCRLPHTLHCTAHNRHMPLRRLLHTGLCHVCITDPLDAVVCLLHGA